MAQSFRERPPPQTQTGLPLSLPRGAPLGPRRRCGARPSYPQRKNPRLWPGPGTFSLSLFPHPTQPIPSFTVRRFVYGPPNLAAPALGPCLNLGPPWRLFDPWLFKLLGLVAFPLAAPPLAWLWPGLLDPGVFSYFRPGPGFPWFLVVDIPEISQFMPGYAGECQRKDKFAKAPAVFWFFRKKKLSVFPPRAIIAWGKGSWSELAESWNQPKQTRCYSRLRDPATKPAAIVVHAFPGFPTVKKTTPYKHKLQPMVNNFGPAN